jgi:acyl-CoA thioester hydrolase
MQNTVLTNIHVVPTPGKFSVLSRVYNQDIDAGRMVYVGNYMNFLERARTEWFHYLGLSQRHVERNYRAFFVARDLHLDCYSPAYLDDVLKVSISVKSLGRSKMVWAHSIERNGAVLVNADLTAVWVDLKTLKPVAMPPEVREKFQAEFEQRSTEEAAPAVPVSA